MGDQRLVFGCGRLLLGDANYTLPSPSDQDIVVSVLWV